MKEDPSVYRFLVKETEEKNERLQNRYNFGLEVQKIKNTIFEKHENEKNSFLPKIEIPEIIKHSGSQSHRSEKSLENPKKLPIVPLLSIFFFLKKNKIKFL